MAHGVYRQPTLTEQVQNQSPQISPLESDIHLLLRQTGKGAWVLAEKPFCVC